MRHIIKAIEPLFIIILILSACSNKSVIVYWTEGETVNGKSNYTIRIENARSLPKNWEIWFSQFPAELSVPEDSQCRIDHIQANTYRIVPQGTGCSDAIVVNYMSEPLKRHSWAPEGFTLRADGVVSSLNTKYCFRKEIPDGETIFENNAGRNYYEPNLSDLIPAIKSISFLGGETIYDNITCKYSKVNGKKPGWYKIHIQGHISIYYSDCEGYTYANQTLEQLVHRYDGHLQNMVVEDYPDLPYRGIMIDVARNFTTKSNLIRLIDLFARYKINYLHLHLSDDEGWRLSIDDIPELTSVGAFHSLPIFDGGRWIEESALQPSYDGNADISSSKLSNGYYSRDDFEDIIKYAWLHGIKVIPEFDMPAHSRAAIKSMIAYEKRTGDTSLRLQDPEDKSTYTSAQGYTDNVISVNLPSVYKFIDILFDEVIKLYSDAEVPLPCIHIGGDEVADGAWNGKDLRELFVSKVLDIAERKDVKIGGWQEIINGLSKTTARRLKESLFVVNCWNTVPTWGSGDIPYMLANDDYPVILSNVLNTYADQAYSSSRYEIAHSWAGYIDAQDSFSLLPFDVCQSRRDYKGVPDSPSGVVSLEKTDNIKGVQAQLFSETIRSFDDLTYDLLPKIIGVFERGWNAYPNWEERTPEEYCKSFDEYYSTIIKYEMPYWASQGFKFHIPQPGIIIRDKKIITNSAIPEANIKVSTRGGISAYAEYLGERSVPTVFK